MDTKQWYNACQTLLKLSKIYGIDHRSRVSGLNTDGSPFEIAYAFSEDKYACKVIFDPFPEISASIQRKRVQKLIQTTFTMDNQKFKDFLSIVDQIGSGKHEDQYRYWIAKNINNEDIEIYSALGENKTKQQLILSSISSTLNLPIPIYKNRMKLGPISINSKDLSLTLYYRPSSVLHLKDYLPPQSREFLEEFSNKPVSKNGILISQKFNCKEKVCTKLDICGHCVSPNFHEANKIASSLGYKFLSKKINLPVNSKVSFWGISWCADWNSKNKLYIYLNPSLEIFNTLNKL